MIKIKIKRVALYYWYYLYVWLDSFNDNNYVPLCENSKYDY